MSKIESEDLWVKTALYEAQFEWELSVLRKIGQEVAPLKASLQDKIYAAKQLMQWEDDGGRTD
jgi:hypothetical protein